MKNILNRITGVAALLLLFINSAAAQSYVLDENFGTREGRALFPNELSANAIFTCILLLPDGKIVAGGYTVETEPNSYRTGLVCRFNANGKPDSSFGENGVYELSWQKVYDIGMADNGSLFFCGNQIFNGPGNIPVQYGTVGYTNGIEDEYNYVNYGGIASPSTYYKLKMLPGGKVICAGDYTKAGTGLQCILAQFKTSNLYIDNAFGGGDGYVIASDGNPASWLNGNSTFYGLDIAPNGKIVAVGAVYSPGDLTSDQVLSRWNKDGSQDNTFYSNAYNVAVWNSGNNENKNYDVVLDNSGYLCLAGYSTSSINVNGKAEWQTYDFNTSVGCNVDAPYSVFNVVEKHDGGMIFGGCAGENEGITQMVISRIKSSTQVDEDFGAPGSENLYIPKMNGSIRETITGMAVGADNNIYAAGHMLINGLNKPVIVKLKKNNPNNINEAGQAAKMNVMPNPASDYIQIGNTRPIYIEIYNLMGVRELSTVVPPGKAIDISMLPAGMYLIKADNKASKFSKL